MIRRAWRRNYLRAHPRTTAIQGAMLGLMIAAHAAQWLKWHTYRQV